MIWAVKVCIDKVWGGSREMNLGSKKIINNYDHDDHGMYHLKANLQLVSLLLLPVPTQVGNIPMDLE